MLNVIFLTIFGYILEIDFFFDPSYGEACIKENSTLQHYCKDNLTSIVVENRKYNQVTDFSAFNGFVVYEDIEKYIVCSNENLTK